MNIGPKSALFSSRIWRGLYLLGSAVLIFKMLQYTKTIFFIQVVSAQKDTAPPTI